MDVSIIIINYNTLDLTTKCIESVKDKTKGVSYEIIVVDNDSKEAGTKEKFNSVPDIKFIPSSENLGFAKGNNLGIEHAAGEYILLLNSDTELINDAVSICHNYIKDKPDVGVVSAQLQYPDGRVQFSCKRFPSVKYLLFERLRLFKLIPKRKAGRILLEAFFKHDERVEADWIAGTFYMIKAKILLELPQQKLADDFFMYGEDMQWGFEFKKLDYKLQFLPEAKVLHHVGASSDNSVKWMNENRSKLFEMYYSIIHRKSITFLERYLVF